MTADIAIVFSILAGAMALFVSGKLRVDVVALMVLVTLVITGLLEPEEALSGFSNPAVVTVWAVFILSGGLSRTGVAGALGKQVLRVAGSGGLALVTVIMLVAGFLSAFMNNVGVAAMLLPVLMDIARRTGRSPSKLLMPLSYACLLGGLTTMIGTPPNILVSEVVSEAGLEPFSLFDFTPTGLAVMLGGIAFLALAGRKLLPERKPALRSQADDDGDLRQLYDLGQNLFVIRLPEGSALDGATLAESRLGTALEINVISILRGRRTLPAPGPETTLQSGDRLLVAGRTERVAEIGGHEYLTIETDEFAVERLLSSEIEVVEVELLTGCSFAGRTLAQLDFRNKYGAIVLAILRDGTSHRTGLERMTLQIGDVLLAQGTGEILDRLRDQDHLEVSGTMETGVYDLEHRLMAVQVPLESSLAGKTLSESRLGRAYRLGVMGIVRDGETHLMPGPDERVLAGDTLLVKGRREDLMTVEGLHELEVDSEKVPALDELESDRIGLAEATLAPRTTLAGKTLAGIHFREKYGLSVIAISRKAEVFRHDLRDMVLQFGDGLLLHGPRERLKVLGSEPDFLVLTQEAQEPYREDKMPIAAGIMLGVVGLVIAGLLPIYIAAVLGAVLMVLARALTMDEAYRAIEWQAVFLIAGMLPLGIAMQKTGAAHLVTEVVVGAVGGAGPLAVMAALFMVTALAAQVMPTAAVAILLAPIAIGTAHDLGISPHALAMTIAMAASASFMSPVAHPANVLIMGPGGYRFTDYIRVGFPLTIVCLIIVLVVLPIFWPLVP